jgi:hypothetical protein
MMGYYGLKEELTQENIYKFLLGAEQHNYRPSISTDIEKLNISDVDEYTLETFEELQVILCDGSAYEKIGFFLMEDVKIENIRIVSNGSIFTILPRSVHLNGDFEEMKKIFIRCGFNPDWWITEEIKPEHGV